MLLLRTQSAYSFLNLSGDFFKTKIAGRIPGLGGAQALRASSPYTRLQVRPQSGHMQESANECAAKWNSKSVFLFLSSSLSKINRSKNLKNYWGDIS